MSDDNKQAIRDVVKGAGIVYIGLLLELVIAFVAQVLAARYLSVAGFGGITAGTALLDIGAILGGLGLGAGLTRYLPRVDAARKRMLTKIIVLITFITSIVIGILVVLTAPFLAEEVFSSPDVTVSIRIFGAAIPFAALLNVAVGGIRGQEEPLYRVYIKNLTHPIVRIVLVVGAVVYGLDQAGFAGAYAIPYLVSSVFALWLLHRSLPTMQGAFDKDLLSEVTRYSLPFTISKVSSFIYRSIDIFLILYFLGDEATGIYGVAYAAVSFMMMYSTAFNFLGSPIASRIEKGGSATEAVEMFRTIARWLAIASVCTLVPLGIFATEFITKIYRPRYAAGGPILAVLAIGYGISNVLSVHGPILAALGRSKILSINSVVAATTNLLLNLILIPRYGIMGAAIATVVSFTLRDGLASLEVYLDVGQSPISWRSLQPIFIAFPFLFVTQSLKSAVPGTVPWLIVATGIATGSYVALLLILFQLSATEAMIIRSAQERAGIQWGPFNQLVNILENE